LTAARVAEVELLDKMSAGSVNVATDVVIGASRDLLARVDRAASAYRNRQRMPSDATLQFIAPSSLRSMVVPT